MYIKTYIWLKKTWSKISLLYQNYNMAIFKNLVLKQAIDRVERIIKIITIPNKYNNIFNNPINNLNIKFLVIIKLINKLYNIIGNSKNF